MYILTDSLESAVYVGFAEVGQSIGGESCEVEILIKKADVSLESLPPVSGPPGPKNRTIREAFVCDLVLDIVLLHRIE